MYMYLLVVAVLNIHRFRIELINISYMYILADNDYCTQ